MRTQVRPMATLADALAGVRAAVVAVPPAHRAVLTEVQRHHPHPGPAAALWAAIADVLDDSDDAALQALADAARGMTRPARRAWVAVTFDARIPAGGYLGGVLDAVAALVAAVSATADTADRERVRRG